LPGVPRRSCPKEPRHPSPDHGAALLMQERDAQLRGGASAIATRHCCECWRPTRRRATPRSRPRST
jgi:hypothetical protein